MASLTSAPHGSCQTFGWTQANEAVTHLSQPCASPCPLSVERKGVRSRKNSPSPMSSAIAKTVGPGAAKRGLSIVCSLLGYGAMPSRDTAFAAERSGLTFGCGFLPRGRDPVEKLWADGLPYVAPGTRVNQAQVDRLDKAKLDHPG
jgi:hypothetical protein